MTETSRDAAFWRRRLVAVVRDEKAWQAELNRRSEVVAAQAEQLSAAQRSHQALEAARQHLAEQLEAMRRIAEDREREIARLAGQLHEVWSSFSWYATIPLRSISARLPGLARGLRGIGQRHPQLWDAGVRGIRSVGRTLLLKSPVAPDPAPPFLEPTPTVAASAPDLPDAPPLPLHWLFLGDPIERREEVDRIANKILLASLSFTAPLLPCTRAPTEAGLASMPLTDVVSRLDAETGLDRALLPSSVAASPAAGDHVLFTGACWTSFDSDLLLSLVERGITFSLFVFDIVSALDNAPGHEPLAAWLRSVLTHARCVFVPSATARDLMLRWAALSDICVSAAVSAVELGTIPPDERRRWVSAYDAMAACMEKPAPVAPLEHSVRLFLPGILPPEPLSTLELAQAWCTEEEPQVSILLVNRNAYRLTRACIQQIWAHTSGIRYEIVVVDNGSGPAECRALSALGRGIRLLPLGADRFFGEACNIAAEHARAPLLCLLRNDCFGQPGWLEILVEALETDRSAGAAGPLLLSPDMTEREAGGTITEQGFLAPFGGGEEPPGQPRSVDYVSAAALLVRRDAYTRAGGLDLMYEPVSYEDVDFCFKLRALGLAVRSCPSAHAIQDEAGQDKVLADLNRSKFVSRWSSFLRSRSDTDLLAIKQQIFIDAPAAPEPGAALPTAALYTPYAITPGGGERFLLTIASELMQDHRVTIVTPHPYSQMRLQSIAYTFGIDLSRCLLQTELAFFAEAPPDLMVVLGNYIYPPIAPRTPHAVFICQFPFPMMGYARRIDEGYRVVIAYSDYARGHILAAQSAHHMPPWPVEIVYPPVPQVVGDPADKRPMILTVGRFFTGGHNKRHDLMIDAFRRLLETVGGEVEMHLAGSSTPGQEHMQYLEMLMRMAEGMPITFHVNAARDTLEGLYRRAAIYWHATGLGGDLASHPELAEHFGISLVEAMSAECVPLAFDAGGPREIITPGVDGFLYTSADELVSLTADVLRPGSAARRQEIGRAAGERAKVFAPEHFNQRVREVLLTSAGA